ncbi:MAG: DUF3105 domain-containing protein [Anaerolineales bacterium]|nr:DUF3105 domain-containing protein [Anaerolineales bacterium]
MTQTPPSSRQTRKAQAAQAARSGIPTPALVIGGILLALVLIIGVATYFTIQERTALSRPIEGVQQFPGLERGHVQGIVQYPQTPPAGGPHNAQWQNCGIYDQPVLSENAVHSLEHGAVWITYQPELDAASVEKLRSLATGREYTLLSPFPGLPSPIVASAWGLQLQLTDANDARLPLFIRKYQQGPQTPEPGAVCTSGVGQPDAR